MKQLGLILAMIMLFSACGPAPTAAPTPDIQATVEFLSSTIVAATLTAMPTNTLPPTSTLQPSPTFTSMPTETSTPAETSTPEATPTFEFTPTPWSGTFAPGNTEGLPTGFLRIENLTGEDMILFTLNGVTLTREQPVTYSNSVTTNLVMTILWAKYQYFIQIPNKRLFTGTFTQGNKDKTTIRVYLNKDPVILGP